MRQSHSSLCRLNNQVAQLLDSQRRLLQRWHQTQDCSPSPVRTLRHQPPADCCATQTRSCVPDASTSIEFEAHLDQQLLQLQQQIDQLRKEPEEDTTATKRPQSPPVAAAVPSSALGGGCSSVLGREGWVEQAANGQQQDVIAEQAATICDLKCVIKGQLPFAQSLCVVPDTSVSSMLTILHAIMGASQVMLHSSTTTGHLIHCCPCQALHDGYL